MIYLKYPMLILVALIITSIFISLLVLGPLATNHVLDDNAKGCRPWNSKNIQFQSNQVVSVSMELIASGMPIILPQDDQHLIDYILSMNYIQPPSTEAYNLNEPNSDPSRGQGQFIRKLLSNMTNGFFVECGALDGETRSNTLFMERHLNWKGLLVEGDPKNYALLQKKNRKAWASSNCLSVKPHPHTASFLQSFSTGQVLDTELAARHSKENYVEVQCMPLFSLLAAINVTTVDYFSLDVEGSELKVLKTIPFDKIFIRTMSVEYIHTTEGKDELINFMTSKDYKVVGEVHYPGGYANDVMFAHKDIELPLNW